MRSRSTFLWVCAVLAASAGCGGASEREHPDVTLERPAESGRVDWDDCFDELECGTLVVPLDYDAPFNNEISISLIRRRAAVDDDWRGVLLTNPGGPGASGHGLVIQAEYYFPREIIDHFDIVGFDPRGVGESEGIYCDYDEPAVGPDPSPDSDAERTALERVAREIADACASDYSFELPHVNTMNTARDMDRIREELGVDRISFFGLSYGTVLGAVYAELFPEHVRAFVLDGAIDPTLTFDEWHEGQAAAFESAFRAFLDDCARRRACSFHSDGDPDQAFADLMERWDDGPIRIEGGSDGGTVTAGEAHFAILSSMYSDELWPYLAIALESAWVDRDASDLSFFVGEGGGDGDARIAIDCGDGRAPADPALYHELYEKLTGQNPLLGASLVYSDLPCAFWPESADPLPDVVRAEGAPPILVIGTTGDVAAPYIWAQRLSRGLESGVLLTFEGRHHTASGQSTCIDELVLIYLMDLELPPPRARYCR